MRSRKSASVVPYYERFFYTSGKRVGTEWLTGHRTGCSRPEAHDLKGPASFFFSWNR